MTTITGQLADFCAGLRTHVVPEPVQLCRKIAFSRQNPKIVCWKINDFRVQTFLFSVMCDRAPSAPPCPWKPSRARSAGRELLAGGRWCPCPLGLPPAAPWRPGSHTVLRAVGTTPRRAVCGRGRAARGRMGAYAPPPAPRQATTTSAPVRVAGWSSAWRSHAIHPWRVCTSLPNPAGALSGHLRHPTGFVEQCVLSFPRGHPAHGWGVGKHLFVRQS
jgi:hypothetical protein